MADVVVDRNGLTCRRRAWTDEGLALSFLASVRRAWRRPRQAPPLTHTDVLRRAAAVLARPAEAFFPEAVDEVGRVLAAELVYIGEFTRDGQLTTVAVNRQGHRGEDL